MRRYAPQQRRGTKRRRTNNTFQRQNRQVRRRRMNPRNAGFLGIENKYLDCEFGATTLSTAGWVAVNPTGTNCTDSISVPAIGDTESSRDGKNYAINSIHMKGILEYIETEVATSPVDDITVRLVMYWDKQTNASEATATDVMDAGGSHDVLAFRNLQHSTRFQVLMDKTFIISPQEQNVGANTYATGQTKRRFQFNKKFKTPIRVNCVGTTANVASVSDNNFGILACVDAANFVQLKYQTRVRFIG